ncbi:MAG: hypothetical protein SFW08_01365 [Gemmatimonadaceae bacterium]|nr:hypothetical protein [Gemmatimonadaceae bacterium]
MDSELRLAEVTVFVLRAALVDGERFEPLMIEGSGGPLLEPMVLQYLARLPKPIECTMNTVGSKLSLRFAAITSAEGFSRLNYQLSQLRRGDGLFGSVVRELSSVPNQKVRLVDGDRELLVSSEDLVAWQEQYVIRVPMSVTVSSRERDLGYPIAISIGPSSRASSIER